MPPLWEHWGKVESINIRTIDEALGIPTEESHTVTYDSANWLLNVIRGQHIEFEMKEIDVEERDRRD